MEPDQTAFDFANKLIVLINNYDSLMPDRYNRDLIISKLPDQLYNKFYPRVTMTLTELLNDLKEFIYQPKTDMENDIEFLKKKIQLLEAQEMEHKPNSE